MGSWVDFVTAVIKIRVQTITYSSLEMHATSNKSILEMKTYHRKLNINTQEHKMVAYTNFQQ